MEMNMKAGKKPRVRFDPTGVVGKRYGRLVIQRHIRDVFIDRPSGIKQVHHIVECGCDCGNVVEAGYQNLENGNTRSCGCLHIESATATAKRGVKFDPQAVVGQRFERLTITRFLRDEEIKEKSSSRPSGFKIRTKHIVECKCTCGKTIEADYKMLLNGKLKSCGCLRREMVTERNRTHGLSKDELGKALFYNVYTSIIKRRYDKDNEHYADYGGRGIYICDEWYTPGVEGNPGFVNFYKWSIANGYRIERDGSGRNRLSIDRIDNDGPYAPWNCRWTTQVVQANNKRSNKHIKDYDGIDYTFGDFARRYDLDPRDVLHKHQSGWSNDAILYYAHNQDIDFRRCSYKGRSWFADRGGYQVLVPTYEAQRRLYYRKIKKG